jgi:hypothetical protein
MKSGKVFEKDGMYYMTEKAREFFSEMVRELKNIGWDFVGEVTLKPVPGGKMIVEGKIQRILDAKDGG